MKRFLPVAVILVIGIQANARPPADRADKIHPQAAQTVNATTYIDANKILMFVTNNGVFGRDIGDMFSDWGPGTFFPYTSIEDIADGTNDATVLYAAGIFVGGRDATTGELLVAVSEYSSEYGPGPMNGGTYLPDNPSFKTYRLDADSLAGNPNSDYSNWPDDQGAPVDDWGVPVMLGDQMLWSVYNDANSSWHTNNNGQTAPLGIEIQQTTWAHDQPSDPLAGTIFVRYKIFNRGDHTLDDFYLSLWIDPDLGGAPDDLVGCDSINQTMFCYNGDNDDTKYGATPPALGVKVVYGPLVAAPGASGNFDGNYVADHKNLSLTSFMKYINGTDPDNASETYNTMQGLDRFGLPYQYDGLNRSYMHSGDPVAGTGDLDLAPSDKRMMGSFGPLTFAPGDSQFVQIAIVAAEGSDRLNSLANLTSFMSQLGPEPHTQVTIRVPDDYLTIQGAIDAAWPGDIVLVAPGTYTGDGNRDLDFHGKDIVVMSEGGRDVTIIDCEGTATDRHRGFYLTSGESADAVFEGFTFTNGHDTVGAGGWCVGSASPTIRDCAFINNTAEGLVSHDIPGYWEVKEAGRGGAINCNNSEAQFQRCLFSGNVAVSGYQIVNPGDAPEVVPSLGGAARVGGVPAAFSDCTFENNTAEQGGALFLRRSNTSLLDNVFRNNSADQGGAVYCIRSNPNTRRNEFTDNSAISGGAIYCTTASNPAIRNNTIMGCSATDGGGIYLDQSSPTIIDNDISGNTASASGGGISCYRGSRPEIADNTISYNSAPRGGGLACRTGSCLVVDNTFTHNTGGSVGGDEGGGISLVNCEDYEITGNTISDNYAYAGGGIGVYDSRGLIRRNWIENNLAHDGGGIGLCCGSSGTIDSNTVIGNQVEFNGAGIDINSGSTPEVRDNNIQGNLGTTPYSFGGGIRCDASSPLIEGNVLAGNSAFSGGGLGIGSESAPTVRGCTLAGNAADAGGGIFVWANLEVDIENTIVAFNFSSGAVEAQAPCNTSMTHSDIYGNTGGDWSGCIADQAQINGNFSADPMFCDIDSYDFHLSILSPCAPGVQPNIEPIGALGVGCGEVICGDADGNGELAEADVQHMLDFYYMVSDIWPLPVSAGDMDCDGVITIADVVLLAGYIGGYGPAPCCAPPPKRIDLPAHNSNGGLPGD